MQQCPSNYTLALWRTGSLSESECQELESHMQSCPQCAHLLQHRQEICKPLEDGQLKARILKVVPQLPAQLARDIEQQKTPQLEMIPQKDVHHVKSSHPSERTTSWWHRSFLWMGPAFASGIAVLMLMWNASLARSLFSIKPLEKKRQRSGQNPSVKHIKPMLSRGNPKSAFYFRMLHSKPDEKKSRWVRHNQSLSPGTLIQFSYFTSRSYHARIVCVDAMGKISPVMPYEEQQTFRLQKGKGKLPSQEALILDNSIGREVYLLFYAPKAFTYKQVSQAIRLTYKANGKHIQKLTEVPGPWMVKSIFIVKQHP